MKHLLTIFLFASLAIQPIRAIALTMAQVDKLVVHEWGTVTTRHSAEGSQNGFLNIISPEDVLPSFVHRLDLPLVKFFMKSAKPSAGHPSVTMRLETPVIYFYPEPGFNLNEHFNLSVDFHGGIINEYYPKADATFADLERDTNGSPTLTENVTGSLKWRNLRLVKEGALPDTDRKVWLAPRAVQATTVQTEGGESEKYLFYRGVAHLPALFRTTHDLKTREISLFLQNPGPHVVGLDASANPPVIPALWLITTRPDGKTAFQELPALSLENKGGATLMKISAQFQENEFSKENLLTLRTSLHDELFRQGLFNDEAEAMLNTWEHAYFSNPGTRLLYIVPQEWIKDYLPLSLSIPADITRVLVGRIDFAGL